MTVTDSVGVVPSGLICNSYQQSANKPVNNQCTAATFGYDASGNLNSTSGRSMTYDAANRQVKLTDGGMTQYLYDGEGRRVQKVSGSQTTTYVYDAMGQLAAEYGGSTGTGPGCYTCYMTTDHLGSTRLVTDEHGVPVRRWDYTPFGWEINGSYGKRPQISGYVTSDSVQPKFTGKMRDYESGLNLDYFGARYMSAAQGRFTSADPALESADPANPQTWNRYVYALNNPLKFVDRNGKWPTSIHNDIILAAFPGLASEERRVLNKASYDTDYTNRVNGHGPQDPESSFVHGMTDAVHGQSPSGAETDGNAFIQSNEQGAQVEQAKFQRSGEVGLSPTALQLFGNALHTVVDRTSPTHEGNQPWHGTAGASNKVAAAKHVAGEVNITARQMGRAVKESREAFRKTFGDAAYKRAIQAGQQREAERKKIPSQMDR
ncbi:RHS repeat domain-containing protein [Paludibaculum fermentans]|uniref:RHS repeat domain-containing protein n=1 Tax=Paludibaculum fermentans TaxID=1473598 RepID=UPI003EB9C94C